MSRAADAAELLTSGQTNCSQAVLSVFCEDMGLDKADAQKIALAFGGGMGRTGGICGAVTGAYMVLGLRDYPDAESPAARKEKVYALVGQFNQRFKALFKSLNCTELLGCDLSTPEGRATARERKAFSSDCPGFVAGAVTILETLA